MKNLNSISELENILKKVIGERSHDYRQAYWLKDKFQSNRWTCAFPKARSFDIDFNITLADGGFLTGPKHGDLLDVFKTWLTSQTHSDVGCGKPVSDSVAAFRVSRTLHLIDYFLLNQETINLSHFGLQCVTENDLRGLLMSLSNSSSVYEGVYKWQSRLTEFLRENISATSIHTLENIIEKQPAMATDIIPRDQRLLELTESEIIYSRAWLWANGYYRYNTGTKPQKENLRFTANTELLARTIYANTLRGQTPKPLIRELHFFPTTRVKREYRAAPVRSNTEDLINESSFQYYLQSLSSLELLAEIGLPVPISALSSVAQWKANDILETKTPGRFRTLPSDIVFSALRHAITLIVKDGDLIVDAAINVLKPPTDEQSVEVSFAHSISDLACIPIERLGVRYWSLTWQIQNIERHPMRKEIHGEQDFHDRLRNNEGLRELIQILYGAVAICVGTLMARRSSELYALHADTALDETSRYLIFGNSKSGVLGLKEVEARPIPKIAARAIQLLIRLQDGLVASGYIPERGTLFSYPKLNGKGVVKVSHMTLNEAIDLFCDYAQIGLDTSGNRYYIRQHQLRRFFAMLFFWGSSFGRMDTLRWFMGHTDVEHLYHYITESTPGSVLRSVKSQFAAEQVLAGGEEFVALSALVKKHFGTKNFSVLDTLELDEYIEELLAQGLVDIEPAFFNTPDGKSYRILVKISALTELQ